LGVAIAKADADVAVSGVVGTVSVGSVSVIAKANVFPIGVSARGIVANALVWGKIPTNQNANWTTINVGNTVIWTKIPT
jgi:hypothetical protein